MGSNPALQGPIFPHRVSSCPQSLALLSSLPYRVQPCSIGSNPVLQGPVLTGLVSPCLVGPHPTAQGHILV